MPSPRSRRRPTNLQNPADKSSLSWFLSPCHSASGGSAESFETEAGDHRRSDLRRTLVGVVTGFECDEAVEDRALTDGIEFIDEAFLLLVGHCAEVGYFMEVLADVGRPGRRQA